MLIDAFNYQSIVAQINMRKSVYEFVSDNLLAKRRDEAYRLC